MNVRKIYDIPKYISVTRSRKTKRGGGVSLLVVNHISFVPRNDLAYFDCEMESSFIEIDKSVFQSSANIIIGVVYRMPDSSVDVFNEHLTDILNFVHGENKLCYLLGDPNINIFLNMMCSVGGCGCVGWGVCVCGGGGGVGGGGGGGGGGGCVPLRSQMLCQLEFRLLVGLTMLVRLWRRGQTKCNTPLMLVTSVFGLIL